MSLSICPEKGAITAFPLRFFLRLAPEVTLESGFALSSSRHMIAVIGFVAFPFLKVHFCFYCSNLYLELCAVELLIACSAVFLQLGLGWEILLKSLAAL